MIDAGQVVIKLTADTGGYKTTMSNAASVSDKAMSSMMGGIKALGAVVTAVIASQIAKQFTEFADQASKFDNLTNSFNNFAGAVSGGGPAMMRALKQASGGMIAQTDLMKNYNKAAQLVSRDFAETLPKALPLLQKVAAATGTDLNYLMESFVVGIGRGSKLILDNMGITTDASAANEAYALSIGKKVEALTAEEKQLALTAQVVQLLERNTQGMVDVSDTVAGRIARIKANWEDMRLGLGVALLPLFESAFAGVETFLNGIITAVEDIKLGFAIFGAEGEVAKLTPKEMKQFGATGNETAPFAPVIQAARDIAQNFSIAAENVTILQGNIEGLSSPLEIILGIVESISAIIAGMSGGVAALSQLIGGDTAGAQTTAEKTRTGLQESGLGEGIRQTAKNSSWMTTTPGMSQVDKWRSSTEGSKAMISDSARTSLETLIPPMGMIRTGLEQLDSGFKSFNDTTKTTNTESLTLSQNAGTMSDQFIGLGVGLFGVQNNAGLVSTMLMNMLGPDTTTAVTGGSQSVSEAIGVMSDSSLSTFSMMNTGMATQADIIQTMLANKVAGWVSIVKGYIGGFYSVGVQLMNGLAQGIIDRSRQVINEVIAAVTDIVNAAKKAAGITSPSKVFMEIGNQLMSGMAIGIEQGSGLAMGAVSSAMNGITPRVPSDVQNSNMLAVFEDMNHKLDQMPIWFSEAVQLIT